jgi:hypothetical protein
METSAFLVLQMLLYGEADTLRYNEEMIRSSVLLLHQKDYRFHP